MTRFAQSLVADDVETMNRDPVSERAWQPLDKPRWTVGAMTMLESHAGGLSPTPKSKHQAPSRVLSIRVGPWQGRS